MVQVAFFLRFRRQLRRTRPTLVPRLEDATVKAVREAGGEIAGGNGAIAAAFDEGSPGFWLDMLLLIERLTTIVEGAEADLHGFAVLLGEAFPGESGSLCRVLSGGLHGGGVFLDQRAADALRPYVTVEEKGKWSGLALFRLKEEKIFVSTARTGFMLPEKNVRLFEPGRRPAVLVVGRVFEGKRDSLYRRVAGFAGAASGSAGAAPGGGLPPLFLRFGGGGLCAITDSWPAWMGPGDLDDAALEKAASARAFLFRHRLRGDPPPFAVGMARRLLGTLLDALEARAAKSGTQPVVVLENVQAAEREATDAAIEALSARRDFILAGVCSDGLDKARTARWEPLFPRVFGSDPGDAGGPARAPTELPADLWEMGYLCLLLGRVFPPDLIPPALEEMGKNPGMVSRSISMLHALRIIDTQLDPRPWRADFHERAEAALGGKKEGLRALVRARLLEWVDRGLIAPCVGLLERLAELGGAGETDDALVLRAIHGELSCSDGATLGRFVDSERLESIAGEGRLRAIRNVALTLLALHFGDEREIRDAFARPPPECQAFPLLRAQTLLNQALFHLGWHDGESATRAVKTATLLCQKSGSPWLSRCHRLFALASLSDRRIGETNEYLGFALENAVKSGDPQEIGLASYYTAAVQFLHGNLSRSLTLAKKALGSFLEAGSPEWADKSRFLEGRLVFEIGDYGRAAALFDGIREGPDGGNSAEKDGLLEAWAFRAQAYAAKSPPRPRTRSPDAEVFEMEALYLNGDHKGAAAFYERLALAPAKEDFFHGTEQADWRSGFSQCELLCFSWRDFRNRMLGACRALAQSRLSPRDGEAAAHSLQQILQNSRFAEMDPSDAFYHYAYYDVLRQTGAGQIDLRTAASKGRQRMQVRSERIDGPEIRREYLTRPRWNKALEEAAREFKLV